MAQQDETLKRGLEYEKEGEKVWHLGKMYFVGVRKVWRAQILGLDISMSKLTLRAATVSMVVSTEKKLKHEHCQNRL
jgi:hypothetical protein